MALTHRITKRIDLAHEPGQWVDARMPSLDILDRARQAQVRRALALMEDMDMAKLQAMTAGRPAQDSGPDYDWLSLLRACVTAWSYPEPVTPETVAELDEATVKAVLAELVPAETEAERKNV